MLVNVGPQSTDLTHHWINVLCLLGCRDVGRSRDVTDPDIVHVIGRDGHLVQ